MRVWELPEYRYGIYKKFVAINYNPHARFYNSQSKGEDES